MGPVIGDARQGGTHNAEILRAGAGAPRGLRRRDHNAEAERRVSPRLSLAPLDGQLLSPPHLAMYLYISICLLHNVCIAGLYILIEPPIQ